MRRVSGISLGLIGLLVLGACADDPGGRSLPTEPSTHTVYGPGDVCNNQLANTISSEISANFTGTVRRELADFFRSVSARNTCGTAVGRRLALQYVGLLIKYKATGNDLVVTVAESDRAKALSHHTDHVTVFAGLGAASVPYQAWLAGGGIALFPTTANPTAGIVGCPAGQTPAAPANAPSGYCGLITEIYNGAGVFQANLTSPVDYDYHIVTLARSSFDFSAVTNLQKLTNDAFQLNYFPAAAGFSPALTGFVCTDDESSEEEAGVGTSFVKVGHYVNGKTDVLPRWVGKPTTYFCSHGAPPIAVAPGARGFLQGLLARAQHALTPRPLYAINEGPDFEHSFADGTSPLGPVNTLVFLADFSNEVVNTSPTVPLVGQAWLVTEVGAGWIDVKQNAGDLGSQPVVLNQAQGCTTDCTALELVGRLAEPNGLQANNGTYSMIFDALQDRPTVFQANHVLESSTGQEIATLRYATVGGVNTLQYNTPTGFVQVGTWAVHDAQNFEIIVNLDTKTTSLKIDGVAVAAATNVPFIDPAAANFSQFAWRNSGLDSGKIAYDNIQIFRHADP